MYSTNFYLVKTNGQEIIRDHKSKLQIKIYKLDEAQFLPNYSELTLYGDNQDVYLAFETAGKSSFGIELVAYALSWYVDYTEQVDLNLSFKDPRPSLKKLSNNPPTPIYRHLRLYQ